MSAAWVFLDDKRRGVPLDPELAARDVLYFPVQPDIRFTEADTLPQYPPLPAMYVRAYPRRYEFVVAETTTVREGEPLGGEGATKIPYVEAVVFERVGVAEKVAAL